MDRSTFLRRVIRTFLEPATEYGVSAGEGKHILEDLVGVYVSKQEFIRLMFAEGFAPTPAEHNPSFKAKYRCEVALLLNQHWSREYIRSHFGPRQFVKWDSINDAVLVLKHMLVREHNRAGDIDSAVRDILGQSYNDEPREIPEEAPPSR